jgi:uncharacterized membrane protein
MQPSTLHYFPLAGLFFILLVAVLVVLVTLIELRVLQYAYEKMGIHRRAVFAVLLLSLLGSYVNIPVAELAPEKKVVANRIVRVYGVDYVVPVVQRAPGTVLAVNVGGAVIPTILSIYLLVKTGRYWRTLGAVAIVTVVVHMVAKPVPGVGVVAPTLVPPIAAVLAALLLCRKSAPPVAYIAGSMGTLIGADLLNLAHIQGLGAPVASIGGAGTFDGIFLSGILAVLLA